MDHEQRRHQRKLTQCKLWWPWRRNCSLFSKLYLIVPSPQVANLRLYELGRPYLCSARHNLISFASHYKTVISYH